MRKIIIAGALAAGISFAAAGTTNAEPPCGGIPLGQYVQQQKDLFGTPMGGPNGDALWIGDKGPGTGQKLGCTPGNQ